LPKAEEEIARAKKLWKDGAPGDPGLLNEARVLGLEASLLRARRRLPEALKLVADALEIDRWGEAPNLLLDKARVLELAGDCEASRAATPVRIEATPFIRGLLAGATHTIRIDEAAHVRELIGLIIHTATVRFDDASDLAPQV
jgi:hypothetical protein